MNGGAKMKKMLIAKIILAVVILILLYFIGVILLGVFTQYKPETETLAEIRGKTNQRLQKDTLVLYTWNIGYAGLDKKSDFFYDGGEMVRPSEDRVRKNLEGIQQEILSWTDADVVFLQEVDVRAKRSWRIPIVKEIMGIQKNFPIAVFGKNYDVRFVPKPFFEPLGQVMSGILTLSKWDYRDARRISYPGSFPFPTGLFFLNRCFTMTRAPYLDREVIFINTHNSAFDGGVLKQQEMGFLKKYLLEEYAKGNYVIVGGDWNQVPPGFERSAIAQYEETPVPENYPAKGWKWAADMEHRSNRKVDTPFVKGVTYTTIFDFFLLSPNVEVVQVQGLVRDFEYSDHEPVKIEIRLLPSEIQTENFKQKSD